MHAFASSLRRPACATRSSMRSSLMKLTIWRSFTSITGASAQAPRHSVFCTVNSPSAVVPPSSTPEPAAQVLERLLAVAQLARQVGADVELEAPDRLLVVHVVEGRDLVHRDRRHAQVLGHGRLGLAGDVTLLLLHDGQARHHGGSLVAGRVLRHLAREARQGGIGKVVAVICRSRRTRCPSCRSVPRRRRSCGPRAISSRAARCANPGARSFRR